MLNMNRFFLLLGLLCAACEPHSGGDSLRYGGNTASIASLKELYRGEPRLISEDIVVSGRIVSSDQRGNYFKSIVVEDSTGGIEVMVDMERLFTRFFYGDCMRIVCCGLWLGEYGGLLQLGAAPAGGYEVSRIPHDRITRHLSSQGDGRAPRPQPTTAGGAGSCGLNTFVSLRGVRFAEAEEGLSWCDAAEGGYRSTVRHLVDSRGDTLQVYTLGSALFAGQPLPRGELYAEGILSGFGGRRQLRVVFESNVFAVE